MVNSYLILSNEHWHLITNMGPLHRGYGAMLLPNFGVIEVQWPALGVPKCEGCLRPKYVQKFARFFAALAKISG